ncbi:MAG: hypothetical protein IJS39_04950 [Synergistaceae bacterium]|nr:hypothetical protein [Synergistaceae bacterium]
MKKYVSWILCAVLFCAVTYGGCGGSSDNNFAGSIEEDSGNIDLSLLSVDMNLVSVDFGETQPIPLNP